MIGQTLDRYRIESKLGEGGMGVVYQARDTQLDRRVGIKILLAGSVADPDRKRRFVSEAKAASGSNRFRQQ
jgi:serine/threonine protein kinase